MTFEEYMTVWLDYMKKRNVLSFFTRLKPILVPGVQRAMTDDEKAQEAKSLKKADEKIAASQQLISDLIANSPSVDLDSIYEADKHYRDLVDNMWMDVIDKQNHLDNLKKGVICNGGNCIYNASYNYHPATRNTDVLANPRKYGLKTVNRPALFGDIVILKDKTTGHPYHGILSVGNGKYNWSSGGATANDLVKNMSWNGDDPRVTLEFVGTAKDSAKVKLDWLNNVPIPQVKVIPVSKKHDGPNMVDYDQEADRAINEAITNGIDKWAANRKKGYWPTNTENNYLNLFHK